MHLLTKVRLLLINEFSLVGCDAGIALIVGFSEASLAALMTLGRRCSAFVLLLITTTDLFSLDRPPLTSPRLTTVVGTLPVVRALPC